MQVRRPRLNERKEKYYSKETAVVKFITQRESGSAQGFLLQGRAREDGKISVKEGR